MPDNNESLEIRSNEMDEVVGNIPSWIIRWGITVLFLVGMLGIVISYFIRYPDTLSGKVLVQALNQPGRARITKTDENANVVFTYHVKNGDHVVKGDTLFTARDPKTDKITPTTTPMAGSIYLSKGINDKNKIEEYVWVVPPSPKAEIKINYSNKGAGNVKIGQQVRIELSEFPSSEYGFLEGKIASILPLQIDGERQAYVELGSKKMLTSTNKEIPILPLLEGSGEILLSDKSIFQRIFGSVFH
jgi:hypothetical protein